MSVTTEFLLRGVLIGCGATLAMDTWAAVLRRVGVPSLDFALLGRWIGHLRQGRWFHAAIARSTPVEGERWIGWGAHYSIGITFAMLLLLICGIDWARRPTPSPALFFGLITVVAPWFILQPALGAGVLSSRTPDPIFNALKSLMTHLVFGFGLYLAARATANLFPGSN